MTTQPAAERVLGIVGGVGPESTIDYYRALVATWRRRRPNGSYPRVIIDSIEVHPTPEEQEIVHGMYIGELLQGVFSQESRWRLVGVIAAMRDRDGIDGTILGGTELALTLTEPNYAGVPILNTTQIHVDAAVDWLLGEV